MLELLKDAVRSGSLHIAAEIEGEGANPTSATKVTHSELIRFAKENGQGRLVRFARNWKPVPSHGFESSLYVGEVRFDTRELGQDKLSFSVKCFNGTSSPASVSSVRGYMTFQSKDGTQQNLAPAISMENVDTPIGRTSNVPHGEELFAVIEFSIPTHYATEIAARLDAGEPVDFALGSLDIICELGAPANALARMPVRNGVRLRKFGELYITDSVITGAGKILV